ncbi:diguanylate cyclase [Telmatobacter sp. DSM 110680]|uniref:diguanylate cyclase n=1 Tax=Telmatobacter sp. DSM 110680 TaxID=3036704 RepID=A0AAU7DGN4_9BACT
MRVAGSFVVVFVASLVMGLEDCGRLIWFANGLLLSYLLLAPRWLWRRYCIAGFAAILAGGLIVFPHALLKCTALSALNMTEVLIAARLLRKRSMELPCFTNQRYLLRFGLFAVLVAPAAVGAVDVVGTWISTKVLDWGTLFTWFTADGLGTAIVAPACVSLFSSPKSHAGVLKKHWYLPLAFVSITLLSFCQKDYPVIFLLYPVVAMILFRLGLGGASAATLFVAAAGSWFTIHGAGPFSRIGSASQVAPTLLLQLYLASGMFLVFAAGSVLGTLRSTERRLRETVSLHNLVTENSRDLIILADFIGNRSYVSASASTWGGWRSDELTRKSSLELVHPEDRGKAETIVRGMQLGSDGGLLECRVRNKEGEYVWVEANLRPVRDPVTGVPIGVLNMVRDISKRKRAEYELMRANAALEALAVTDAMTHLANRHRFDKALSDEWRRGMREHSPLSLLLLDADWFKSYNDTYGHPRGDSCLKQIAEAMQDVVTRSSDLVARIGGEEFAVILPNTSGDGAFQVADQICAAVRRRKLPHNTNPMGIVTISIGCATVIPSLGQQSSILMQRADNALYAAKNAGRNQVCGAALELPTECILQVS